MTIHDEIERELHHAIRRAWRQATPDWREIEASTTVAAATLALLAERPGLSEHEIAAELSRLGVLVVTPLGRALVKVPPLPGEPLPSSAGGVQ